MEQETHVHEVELEGGAAEQAVTALALPPGTPGPLPEPLPETEPELERLIDAEVQFQRDSREELEWRFGRLVRYLAAYSERRYWELRGFASMNAFLEAKAKRFGISRGSLYGAKYVGVRIAPFMEESQMRRIGKSKLYLIAGRTQDGVAPNQKFVKAAEAMPYDKFEEFMHANKKRLEGETLEDVEEVKFGPFWVERTFRDGLFEEVFEMIRKSEGISARTALIIRVFETAHASLLLHAAEERERSRAVPVTEQGEIIEAEFVDVVEPVREETF